MRLQKHASRKTGNKEYAKWVVVLPQEEIEKLGWKEGEELRAEAKEDSLSLRKEMTYEQFKTKIAHLFDSKEVGFTWQEIKDKLDFRQAVPNNKWVSKLENDIGLKRLKIGAITYWYINKKGTTIYTIGYEGKSVEQFINLLKSNDIKQLIDVRELAFSRKNGFSKSLLKEMLNTNGIVYKHFSELGSPSALRHKLWNDSNYSEFFKEYSEWLSKPEANEYLVDLEGLAQVRKTAIMCFEKDIEKCHRSIIKKRLIKDGFKIVDI